MKQLLFLLLFPCLCVAQYTGNAGQKITLGEQTTADGLVFRGLAADTTRKPSVDTMAYILLDTNTNIIWQYKKATSNAWTRVGGSISSGVTGVLPVANGGTGASVKIFVDTFSNQTINAIKTFNNIATFNDSIKVQGIKIGRGFLNDESNIAIGLNTLTKNTNTGGGDNGKFNTAIGVNVLKENTTGQFNIGIGFDALLQNTTGSGNFAIGPATLNKNTTGFLNVALGINTLGYATNGSYNTAIGINALEKSTSSLENNVAIGYQSLINSSSGNNNTAVGTNSGLGVSPFSNANTTGSNNIFIGYQSVGASATASNVITLGNSSITTIRAQVTTITSLSDIRDKTQVMPLNYGINFIDKLKPVSFIWDMRDGGKIGIPEIGFIAQDLQQAQIDSGINIPNLISGVDEKLEASYGVLLPIIVKALQEANEKIKSLEKRILNLENK